MKIMMLCKDTIFCEYAIKILKSYFAGEDILIVKGNADSALDDELPWHKPEYIISFLSPWIIPSALLKSAGKAAINFHPGSPLYPGSGCYNFALYERAPEYGVTCHHMAEKVDTGNIIMTSNFAISPNETVESLKLKSMNHLLFLFDKILYEIHTSNTLPKSDEKWLRSPYTKKMLDELCKVDPATMDQEEIGLRVQAMDYCSAYEGAYIDIGGTRFFAKASVDKPLA